MRISDWSSDVCSSDLSVSQLSTAAIWRPHATQNIVFRLSGATLLPGAGFRDLDRKSVVKGKSVSVRVDLGGRRIIKKKKQNAQKKTHNYRYNHHTTQIKQFSLRVLYH